MKKAAKKVVKKTAPVKAKSTAKPQKKSATKPAKKTVKPASKKAKPAAKKVAEKKKSAAKSVVTNKRTVTKAKSKPPVKKAAKPTVKPKLKPVVSIPLPPPTPMAPPPPPPAPKLPSSGQGSRDVPWVLKTPNGGAEFQAFRDESLKPPALVVRVGSTELRYHLRCLDDLHEMLRAYGDWMLLGPADEQQPVVEGTVESWARSPGNPVGGWYGLKNGLRGRFAVYIPPLMEALGLAEVEHFPLDNRMRAK